MASSSLNVPIILKPSTPKKPILLASTHLKSSTAALHATETNHSLRSYSVLLQGCTSRASLVDGKAIHARLLRTGVEPDTHLWDCLVNMYCKCGRIGYARRVFEEMPQRDVVAWTALMTGYALENDGVEGVRLFREMQREGVRPNGFALAAALKACSMCLDLEFGRQVHGEAVKLDFLLDLFVGSALVDLYAKCEEMELAEKAFFCLPERNAVTWNVLLNGYAHVGDEKKIMEIFCWITESETRFCMHTLTAVLKCCAGLSDGRLGQTVHSLVIKIGLELDGFLSSSLVDMYSKCGLLEDAYRVFVCIRDADVVVWSAMISCFSRQGLGHEAIDLFKDMQKMGVKPNQFTLASIASVAYEFGDLRFCGSVHAFVIKSGLESDNTVSNAILNMYMKGSTVRDGYMVFNAMTNHDTISWNGLLSGFHSGNYYKEGLRIFNQMLTENFKPNRYTFISILRTCSSLLSASYGTQVHAHILKNSLEEDPYVRMALVDMYANCGNLQNACLVFDRLKEKDVFTWTVIISGFAKTDQGEKAIECYHQMQREGVTPNEFTLASCLRASSDLAALDSGRQLHSWIIKLGHSDPFVSSALVDMYVKCGCLRDAEAAFDTATLRDDISWNTIICGYSQHGYGQKALKAFQRMINEGASPDEVTFIGVLSACSHAGFVEEGRRHFDSLRHYGITPTVEHHACMLDILGRAGKLDEVEHYIDEMTPITHALIWQTVLGACRMHGNLHLGERAAKELFRLEPHMDSTYVLLSNMYAANGRWDDVNRVRTMMSSRGVKKEPGCSWIEVNGQVDIFLPHDASHPMKKEIYLKLKELTDEIISAGYVPSAEYVLHDVTDDKKKESLLYHSERLALAYGLITIKSKASIRIFKNLRICGDCHNAIKIISRVTGREIIIRDVSRFHHFQNGSCSCEDYW